jgi:hypothetical protein
MTALDRIAGGPGGQLRLTAIYESKTALHGGEWAVPSAEARIFRLIQLNLHFPFVNDESAGFRVFLVSSVTA